MDYKEQWNEIKNWLADGIHYCKKKSQQVNDPEEWRRLIIKTNTLEMTLNKMRESERL